MPLTATYKPHILNFKFEAGTSRGVLTEKEVFYISIFESEAHQVMGTGECNVLKNLSIDDVENYETELKNIIEKFNSQKLLTDLIRKEGVENFVNNFVPNQFPSIRFAFETALIDLINGGKKIIFKSDFTEGYSGIPINGLIWMGMTEFMQQQISEKLEKGYTTLKMKIGAISFEDELELLKNIRRYFTQEQIIIRVDANGSFSFKEIFEVLDQLSELQIHSIEQPIRQGQIKKMAEVCARSPIPVALDEELIGVHVYEEKKKLLESIKPQYIILKPALLGGFYHCREWIKLAEQLKIKWWVTSALESNIGLNAIAQFTFMLNNQLPQGLGTGQLYQNNISSPLYIKKGFLKTKKAGEWGNI